jgi:hypothetical protein
MLLESQDVGRNIHNRDRRVFRAGGGLHMGVR